MVGDLILHHNKSYLYKEDVRERSNLHNKATDGRFFVIWQ